MRLFLAGIWISATMVWGVAAAAGPTAEGILAAYHAAVGNVPDSGCARVEYALSESGLQGSRKEQIDLQSGAFVQNDQTDILSEGKGFDGRIPWMRDTSGANTPQQGGDRIPVAINEAYRLANLWWRPGYSGAMVSYVGRSVVDGKTLDQLTVTPRQGKPFGAWFDANTRLLVLVTEDREFLHTRTYFEDYQVEHGLTIPHSITVDPGSGKENYRYLHLRTFSIGAPVPLSAYARPTAPPVGATIDGDAPEVTIPFRLLNNHIYVSAKVNGKGPYNFIVDTGGHTLLSSRLANEIGLKIVGAAAMSGAGEKTAQSGFTRVGEIALGAVRMRDQLGFVAQIYDKSIEGFAVDGMVGFELFRRFAVRIDYGHDTLTLTNPTRFDPTGAGLVIPFVFYDHLPMVSGKIADLPARFDIDTGSRSEVDITGPFVRAHHLRARFGKGVSAVTGWGVGGPSRSYVVRLPSLTFGNAPPVMGPIAGLSEDKRGAISDPNYDGNIGSGFLKRFVVTFDYAHQKMYLKPARPAPVDVGDFDRAGMWINAGPDGFVVTEVTSGGPAAHAGIQLGDVITELNGVTARAEKLSDARSLLRSKPAKTPVELNLKRGGATRKVTVLLEDQV
jgi:hypothetical protein